MAIDPLFLNNGNFAMEHEKLYHGLKQRDCISPILFLFCEQIFCSILKASSKIKPTTTHSIKCIWKQFCDDTCITVEANHNSLLELERLVDRIAAQSRLNLFKTGSGYGISTLHPIHGRPIRLKETCTQTPHL